ncbi:unnamed protein product [Paramecium primaurelia]|uniref:Uncharacterized protein n=1 Tax=Paramecium primaurelia TaxID=5886 RepID=A0A8S1MNH9_PARPR|nr:unnamed protein product [Paramecium primaurelia]
MINNNCFLIQKLYNIIILLCFANFSTFFRLGKLKEKQMIVSDKKIQKILRLFL